MISLAKANKIVDTVIRAVNSKIGECHRLYKNLLTELYTYLLDLCIPSGQQNLSFQDMLWSEEQTHRKRI